MHSRARIKFQTGIGGKRDFREKNARDGGAQVEHSANGIKTEKGQSGGGAAASWNHL